MWAQNVGEYVYKEGTKSETSPGTNWRKNHVIVLKDANLDRAVKDIIGGSFGSAGERCMAASVIVVEETIADQFVEKFKAAAQTIKLEMVWKKESFRPRDSKRGAATNI